MSNQQILPAIAGGCSRWPVFNKFGEMRERYGFCTIAYGKPVTCPKCGEEALYLHQKERYIAIYKCYDCCKNK